MLTAFRQSAAQWGLRIVAYGLALALVLSAVRLARTDWGTAGPPAAAPLPEASSTPAQVDATALRASRS